MNNHNRGRVAAQVALAGSFLSWGMSVGWAQTPFPGVAPSVKASADVSATPAAAGSPAATPAAAATGKGAVGKPGTPAASPGVLPKASASPAAPAITATQPIVVNIVGPSAPKEEPTTNSWAPGLIGMALVAGLATWGFRYAKGRGMTVAGTLKQIGVEMPQDGANGAGQVQPLRPVAPPAPPLPSLADLPSATSAPVGSVAPPPSAPSPLSGIPRLTALAGPVAGELFEVAQGLNIGRDTDNHVPLAGDTTVSRRHARVEATPSGGFQVSDLGSSNGTFVNGQRVSGAQPLSPGDTIQVGASRLRFEA